MNGVHIEPGPLEGLCFVQLPVFRDARGEFLELWRASHAPLLEPGITFVQDNVSVSQRDVIRGLHFQHPHPQGKLVAVLHGEILDVAVDLRTGSPTFAQSFAVTLTGGTGRMLYVPPGYAHGFAVKSDTAIVAYKCTAYYDPAAEGSVRWNDPQLAIDWGIARPVLSARDAAAPQLRDLDPARLPAYHGAVAP